MNNSELKQLIANWNETAEGFDQVISKALEVLGSDYKRELANEVQVSPFIISGWAMGLIKPHMKIQGLVVRTISKRVG